MSAVEATVRGGPLPWRRRRTADDEAARASVIDVECIGAADRSAMTARGPAVAVGDQRHGIVLLFRLEGGVAAAGSRLMSHRR